MTEQNDETNVEIKGLREAASRAKTLESENSQLRRDLAFYQAGINPEADARLTYFIKGYDGELTKDAIVEAAKQAGFISEPAPDPKQQQGLQAQQRISAVAASSQATPPDAEASLETAFRDGGMDALLAAAQGLGIPIASE